MWRLHPRCLREAEPADGWVGSVDPSGGGALTRARGVSGAVLMRGESISIWAPSDSLEGEGGSLMVS